MNQRDLELLEKQFAWLRPAPSYGSLKLAVTVAILLVGIGIGSTMVLHDPNSIEVGRINERYADHSGDLRSEPAHLLVAHIGL